jgi:hypothetical protein
MRGVQLFEFTKDEPCVVIDIAADGQDGDSSIVRPNCYDIGAGEDGWLELVMLNNLHIKELW